MVKVYLLQEGTMQDDDLNTPQWVLREIVIKEIKNHPKNSRYIKKEMADHLNASIKKYGLIDKPIINQDNVLIGGHQRIRILKKQKRKTVECWVPDRMLSDVEVEDLLIGNNLYKGDWDWDHMANNWDVLELLEKGFSEEQLLGQAKEAEQVLSEEKEEKPTGKKKKTCPNCGHEF